MPRYRSGWRRSCSKTTLGLRSRDRSSTQPNRLPASRAAAGLLAPQACSGLSTSSSRKCLQTCLLFQCPLPARPTPPLKRMCDRASRPSACQRPIAGSLKIPGMSAFQSHMVTRPHRANRPGTPTAAAAMTPAFVPVDHSDQLFRCLPCSILKLHILYLHSVSFSLPSNIRGPRPACAGPDASWPSACRSRSLSSRLTQRR